MRVLAFSMLLFALASTCTGRQAVADDAALAAAEIEKATHLKPNLANGRSVYEVCAVCHEPEGWGTPDGDYPQIAGQHGSVTIKQLADIRARNRDNPTMYPFTLLEYLTAQQIADVSAYVARFPMNPNNGVGSGDDLAHGGRCSTLSTAPNVTAIVAKE